MKKIAFILLALISLISHAHENLHDLEAYTLESLYIRDIYNRKGCGMVAIITDSNGYDHHLFKGDRMGKDFGTVISIKKSN